jgi:hypothetical protein
MLKRLTFALLMATGSAKLDSTVRS